MVNKSFSIAAICLFTVFFKIAGQQITSPGTAIDSLFYSNGDQVVVYVFNSPLYGNISGSLTAKGPVDTIPYDYNWAKFNNSSFEFELINNSESINDLDEGGYRVIITDTSGIADTLYALVFINDFNIEITNKDENGQIPWNHRNCLRFLLTSEAYTDSLVYFDIYDNSRNVLYSSVDDIEWITITEDKEFPGIKKKTLDISESEPLVEDAEIRLHVTDKYGSERWDTIKYEPIMVRAKFEKDETYVTELKPIEFFDNYYTNKDQLSAPQAINFFNQSSSKVDTVLWKFDDDSTAKNIDTILHTYIWPDKYEPWLIVSNRYGCIDSTSMELTIELPAAEFEMPNVFEIGGNEKTFNVFRSHDISVTYIDIVIFNRFGQKVHNFKGFIRDWPGWDGTIKGSNRHVKTGVYYYVIKTLDGWEQIDPEIGRPREKGFPKEATSGFVHVYNFE